MRARPQITAASRAPSIQRVALATQVTLVIALAVSAGLLLRSLNALLQVDPGFSPHGAIAMRVDLAGRLNGPDRLPFFAQILERVAAVPGVYSAAFTSHVPMGDRLSMGWAPIPQDVEYRPAADDAAGRIVTPGYFTTAGIQLLEGRDFDSRDVQRNLFVMAINESFAKRIRGEGRDPLHSRFRVLGEVREIVAVVEDVKDQVLYTEGGREVYIPMGQAPDSLQDYDLVVRADDPIRIASTIRDAIWSIDRAQTLGNAVRLEAYIDRTLRGRRLLTEAISAFAVIALVPVALFVYLFVSFGAAQRKKEIAIRVALGAPGGRVTRAVMTDAVMYVSLGLAAGVPLSLAAAAAIRSYLFGVGPTDHVTLVAVCLVVVGAALVAAYVPARRASRVDPIAALRID